MKLTQFQIKNRKVRRALKQLGLVEDREGYWFLPNCDYDGWIIASYNTTMKFSTDFHYDRGNILCSGALSEEYNVSNTDFIIERTKQLLKEIKEAKINKKLERLQEDFDDKENA